MRVDSIAGVSVAAVALTAALTAALFGYAAPGNAATPVPTPAATSKVSVSVVIPGSTSTATSTPTPTPTPTKSGGSNEGSGGGTKDDGQLGTEAFTAPTPPATPKADAPGLKLDHESISAGQWMVATGSGFTPGENVQFVLYPGAIVIGSFTADATGFVIARFKITDDMRPGEHVVEATGWASKHVANKPFTITSVSAGATLPFLWWVLVVLGVLLLGAIALAIYFRRSIAIWFGRLRPTEVGA